MRNSRITSWPDKNLLNSLAHTTLFELKCSQGGLMQASSRLFSKIYETDLFIRIQNELMNRYQVDDRLAQEMTWDFLDLLLTLNSDLSLVDQYFLQ